MPVSVKRIKKLGTPRIDVEPGAYPGIIVAMTYPKETNGDCRHTYGEYIVQLHIPNRGVCYAATLPFDVSINPASPLYGLLAGYSGCNSVDSLYKWLDANGYFTNGIFDERDFIGERIMAKVDRKFRKDFSADGDFRRDDPRNTYNIVTGFAPIPESAAPELNADRLIPYGLVKPGKYEIEKLSEIGVDAG